MFIMIKKTITITSTLIVAATLLTGCIPSNPATPYQESVDDAKQVQKQLDDQTDKINNYDPTKDLSTPKP